MRNIILDVEGMACGGCEKRIQNALLKVEGVKEVVANHTTGTLTINVNGTSKTFNGSEVVTVNAGNVVPFKGTVSTLSKTPTKTQSIHFELYGDPELSDVIEATLVQISETMNQSSQDTPSFEIQVTYQTSTEEKTQTLYRKMSNFPGTIGSVGKVYNYDDVNYIIYNEYLNKYQRISNH